MLRKERLSANFDPSTPDVATSSVDSEDDCNHIFFKSDRMYRHHLLRINYTTYDVRRSQDVINPGTSRRDVMVLAVDDHENGPDNNPFLYARVLGIYHVNVIYTGSGMIDYRPRRVDFLWVRWFHHDQARTIHHTWEKKKLESVFFPPMASDHAFGFLDPQDVLRATYIVPACASGRVHSDLVSLSQSACDSHDWKSYYVNLCVNCSLV